MGRDELELAAAHSRCQGKGGDDLRSCQGKCGKELDAGHNSCGGSTRRTLSTDAAAACQKESLLHATSRC
jgi:hypothetical protein